MREPRIIEELMNMQNALMQLEIECEHMKLPVVFLVPVMNELDIAISRYKQHIRWLNKT